MARTNVKLKVIYFVLNNTGNIMLWTQRYVIFMYLVFISISSKGILVNKLNYVFFYLIGTMCVLMNVIFLDCELERRDPVGNGLQRLV